MAAAPDQHIGLGHWEPAINRKDMRRVLEAAAPHLAAAVPAGVIHIEGTKLSEADVEELAGRWKAAWHEGEHTILPDDTEARIAEAVAAERERCADLLEAAWGIIANAGWDGMAKTEGWQDAAVRWRDRYHAYLDDLLRQGGEGGGT